MLSDRLFGHFRRSRRDRLLVYFVLIFMGLTIYEWRTSMIQSWVYYDYAKKLQYAMGSGPSPAITFPEKGPLDMRRGYVRIPEFVKTLEKNNYRVIRQARFSPQLMDAVRNGISPPSKEKTVAGLSLLGLAGKPVYESKLRERINPGFDDIPGDVIKILLFIENRELLEPVDERQNPVLEWDRMARASIKYIGNKIGLVSSVEGGSTLATQLEKYQHSEGGRTGGAKEKIRQITSASLRVYRSGRDTTLSRREIVTNYINTVPLASVPGYGEVYGLGEGLSTWFETDLKEVFSSLRLAGNTPPELTARAVAFKKIMALFLSIKAPSFYLISHPKALEERVEKFTELMIEEGEITKEFGGLLKSIPLKFRKERITFARKPFGERKAPDAIRMYLLKVLDLPGFYDLDRLDLTVRTTLDVDAQAKVTQMLKQLADKEYVESAGLMQDRMLKKGDPRNVIYSFVLYEKTPWGNALRVQADNLDKPFNVNEGVKLDLGSTAKLRTLAHYLQVIAETYEQFRKDGPENVKKNPLYTKDPITRWMAGQYTANPKITLDDILEAAMKRTYSASASESFFTGGGQHHFENFNKKDNGRVMDIYEATRDSVNLVYIRLMRELVLYHMGRFDVDAKAVLEDPNHPGRKEYLMKIADKESRIFLSQFIQKYRDKTLDQAVEKLLGTRNTSSRHLAILFYAMHHDASAEALGLWLKERKPAISGLTESAVEKLARSYGKPELTLSDYGYLLSRHPLELWTIGYLHERPKAEWKELVQASAGAREQTSSWLFQERNRRPQDIRLRILFEDMAFREMHKGWKKLGYPFDSLVPSYATSIGSSADRPSALAELMGIIINDGIRRPSVKVSSFLFAKDTPYETEMNVNPFSGERVMPVEVARILRKALAGVVENGTARRLYGALTRPDGKPVVIGGKTGSGDNRFETYAKGGRLVSSRVVNRTATFVFYIGDRHFGVITAFMPGLEAADYSFTSSLPVQVMQLLSPALKASIVTDS